MDMNDLRDRVHQANIRWWQDPKTGKPLPTDEERAAMAERLMHLRVANINGVMNAYFAITPEERDLIVFMLTTRSRNKGELMMLMVSEIAEAMEGCRKNLPDDKLPHRSMEEVELADLIIRLFDYAGGFGLDLQGAFDEKNAYNAVREDHKHEARLRPGGKAW